MTRIEALKGELVDIECMDRFYWQTENPDRCQKLGYLIRQDRRRDLITELLKLMESGGQFGGVQVVQNLGSLNCVFQLFVF
jgi:hypothetical protein